jgi:hypothetical protein
LDDELWQTLDDDGNGCWAMLEGEELPENSPGFSDLLEIS